MIWQIVLFSFTIWYAYFRWTRRKLYRMASQLKCDIKTLPLIGHAYLLMGDDVVRMNGLKLYSRQAIKYGLTSIWIGSKFFVGVADAEVIELILKNYLEKDNIVYFFKDFFGNGIIFGLVRIWRPRRKILAPTFSTKNLQGFVKTFSEHSSIMMDQLLKNAPTGNFSIWSYFTSYTMDTICESILGVRTNAQLDPDHPLLKKLNEVLKIVTARVFQPMLHFKSVFEASPSYRKLLDHKLFFNNFLDQIIMSHKNNEAVKKKSAVKDTSNIIEHEGESKTLLDLILDSSGETKRLSNIELKEEILGLFAAGTDTSAVGASYTALILSRRQDVQQKVYQELQEVFEDSGRPLVEKDLSRLKYLDAVIRETLRLHPPAPVILRKIHKDITLPTGLTLVAGTGIAVSIWGVQRNPQYWGADAEEFRPERFLDSAPKQPCAFLAFSYGARKCLGYQYAMMSMKTVIASLLRQYILLPSSPDTYSCSNHYQDVNHEPFPESYNIMMKDANKFILRVKRRK